MGQKPGFFRAKNLSVNTWRSRPDICSLICELNVYPNAKQIKQSTNLSGRKLGKGFWMHFFSNKIIELDYSL